jgi:hypothetical protein
MTSKPEFTESQRLQMYSMRIKDNISYQKIADMFDCSPNGVKKIVQKISLYGTAKNLFGRGRKRCTDNRTDRLIHRLIDSNRRLKAIDVQEVINGSNHKISLQTIRNRFKENQFYSGFARNKPFISEKNKAKRLAFAKKYLSMPMWYWKKVLWSDESKFELKNTKRRIKVYKKRGEGLRMDTINPTIKHDKSVMVWGCVSGSGVGSLEEIPTIMDAKHYVGILTRNLHQSAVKLGIQDNYIFQSDNDPKHTSRLAKKWLEDNHVICHEWPPQSPDLNIIENIWDFIDQKIPQNKRYKLPEFRDAIANTWRNTPQELIDNLISSIPKRLQEVIDNKGGNTSY